MPDPTPPHPDTSGASARPGQTRFTGDRAPVRTPRGLDFVVAALPAMTHNELVALLNRPHPDLDGATALQWLADEGSPALAVLALLTPPQLVTQAQDLLGAKLTAYIASTDDTVTVRSWVDGTATPDDERLFRLAVAACAAGLLHDRDTAAAVQAWFQRRNPALGDISPARSLRESRLGPAGIPVLVAARRAAGVPL